MDARPFENIKKKYSSSYLLNAANHTSLGNYQKVPLDTIRIDELGFWDAVNKRFNITRDMDLEVFARVEFLHMVADKELRIECRANGSAVKTRGNRIQCGASGNHSISLADVISVNAGDYLEIFAYQNHSASKSYNYAHTFITFFTIKEC